jgi:flagellar basal-body rod modification protein FlgD
MPIDPISATGTSAGIYSSAVATDRAPKQTMDSEVFMSLLVTQLRNQDPSSPMDTNQMISQTTQLAMMEKLTELSKTGTENFSLQMRMAAAALVGQDVSYEGEEGTITGVATAVSYAGPIPTVTVGGKEVPLDVISGVATHSASSTASL